MNKSNKTARFPRFSGEGNIDFIEKPIPLPGPGQLLIAPKANALCASDRGQYTRGSSVVPGHEAAGIIVGAGTDTKTQVGTSGVVFLMGFCDECRNCRAGYTNQCLDKRADYGFNSDGGYGPYAVIRENVFFPVDSSIPSAEATLLLDIMGTGGHSIKRAQLLRQDYESLLISGAGPIGLGVLAMAKILLGADFPVLVSDVIRYRLNLAEKMGGIPVDARDVNAEMIKRGYPSVSMVIDTSGKQEARQLGVEMLDSRGTLICVGHGENLLLDVSKDLIGSEKAVLGSEYFRYDELSDNLSILKKNRAYLAQIITHRFEVAQIEQAYEVFWARNTGKVIVEQV